MGMTISSARKATEGRRSVNGRTCSARARIPSPLRSLHLAGTTRRPIGAPALRVGVGDRFLHERRLLIEHGLDRLALQDDPYERIYERVVELVALGAEPDGQRDDLGV